MKLIELVAAKKRLTVDFYTPVEFNLPGKIKWKENTKSQVIDFHPFAC